MAATHHIRVEHDFALPVERVYDFLAEHENLKTLFGLKVERARSGDETRNGVGSVRRLSLAGLLPFEETVTKEIPNELIEYTITKGSPIKDHFGRMVFSSLPSGGSHLVYTIDLGAAVPGLAAALKVGLAASIKRGLGKVDAKA